MKYLFLTIIISMASVTANAGQDEYDKCILKHLKGVKLDVATHLIIQACQENYKTPGFTSEKKKRFNNCILENMAGVESLPAAMEIKSVCHRLSK